MVVVPQSYSKSCVSADNLTLAVDSDGGREGKDKFANLFKIKFENLPSSRQFFGFFCNFKFVLIESSHCVVTIFFHAVFVFKRIFCHSRPANFVANETSNAI